MNIYNVNKRQFEATMKREKITVMDYYDNDKSYDVFFRRNNRSNTPQGKVRFYFAQDTEINVGTVFVMKGTTYLVISRDADESDIYYTCLLYTSRLFQVTYQQNIISKTKRQARR